MKYYNYFPENQWEIKYAQKCYLSPYYEDNYIFAYGVKIGVILQDGEETTDIIKWFSEGELKNA